MNTPTPEQQRSNRDAFEASCNLGDSLWSAFQRGVEHAHPPVRGDDREAFERAQPAAVLDRNKEYGGYLDSRTGSDWYWFRRGVAHGASGLAQPEPERFCDCEEAATFIWCDVAQQTICRTCNRAKRPRPSHPPADAVTPDANGWTPHHGGECPVPGGTSGFVRMRNGQEFRYYDLSMLVWKHGLGSADIIAYRIVQPAPAPWRLPAPPSGRQWHRTDWTEAMLPDGWRPLLLGEPRENKDECFDGDAWRKTEMPSLPVEAHNFPFRTRRPLPAPDAKAERTGHHAPLAPVIEPSLTGGRPRPMTDASALFEALRDEAQSMMDETAPYDGEDARLRYAAANAVRDLCERVLDRKEVRP